MLFVDDSVSFFKAEISEARYMKHIFHLYVIASIQLINFDKYRILFSKGLDYMLQNGFLHILEVWNDFDTIKYLGVSVLMGRIEWRCLII
ncbi:hypothetical protein LINPERHAP1_LOCUS31598 [Linum perenne]